MQHRYALRFENGERRGETIPITGTGITIGRKPGNSVQILDASVSGRHAELVVEPTGVLVRDLGSTNGTRVGNERVSEHHLAHADAVVFGNMRMTFLDTTMADVPAAPEVPTSAAPGESSDAVRTVSAEKVARSRKSSVLALIVLIVAIGGAAAGGWFWLQGRNVGGTAATTKAVEPVEGDLLADGYSFEGESGAWTADEGSAAAFGVDSVARRSGDNGLQATLAGSEIALSRSSAVRVSGTSALTTRGWLRSDGDAEVALGLEFSAADGSLAPTIAWSASAKPADFESVELTSVVPAGFDTARAVVIARAGSQGGAVDVDDVSVVNAANAPATANVEEYQLFMLGSPATAGVLHKIDRALITALTVTEGGVGLAAPALAMNVQSDAEGFAIAAAAGANRTLSLRAEQSLAALGLATLGTGGYRTHSVEFAREGVGMLLLGSGKDLVCLRFEPATTVRGRPESGGFRLEAPLSDGKFAIQLSFRAERDEAQGLARSARNAESQGQLGESLAQWAKLRDEYPFETALLAEADASRARLVEKGLAESRALRQEVENARFFRLLDIFRACRAKADQIAARYKGSEVEHEALALAQQIDQDLAGLEADLDRTEVMRLNGIATALEAQKSPKLAARVREYLGQHFTAPPASSGANGGGR